ncbi:MAG: hypothetical protein ACREBS_02040 [Nitrososphaerales archaeon]
MSRERIERIDTCILDESLPFILSVDFDSAGSVLNSENNLQRLIELALSNNPDQIAIRVLNLSKDGLIHVNLDCAIENNL